MGVDPELQALLEDLRSGYGDAPKPAADAPENDERRGRDWEMRTGYAKADQPSKG